MPPSIYLMDGVPVERIALGLFALPELLDMAIARTNMGSVQRLEGLFREQMRGVRDVLQNWKLVLNSLDHRAWCWARCPAWAPPSSTGSPTGRRPAWSRARRRPSARATCAALIAAESANNAREGGALIPTLAFGVPGSPSMALLLGAFLAHGVAPGPKLLDYAARHHLHAGLEPGARQRVRRRHLLPVRATAGPACHPAGRDPDSERVRGLLRGRLSGLASATAISSCWWCSASSAGS